MEKNSLEKKKVVKLRSLGYDSPHSSPAPVMKYSQLLSLAFVSSHVMAIQRFNWNLGGILENFTRDEGGRMLKLV